MSELTEMETEIRDAAKGCATIRELATHYGWHMAHAHRANEIFSLGLPLVRPGRVGATAPGRAVPKPAGKGSKASGKDAG
jgi:hypothetical protein